MGTPKRYSARAEAVRCADEALRRLRAGETFSAIHADLSERREITMALRTFMQWMRRLETNSPYVPLSAPASNPESPKADAWLSRRDQPQPASSPRRPGGPRHAIAGVPRPVAPTSEPNPEDLF